MAGTGRTLVAAALAASALVIVGCASQPQPDLAPATPSVASAPPATIPASEFVGRWGFAAYHKEADRGRTEVAARGQCGTKGQPYVINPGRNGGIMMHMADQAEPQELRLKGGPGGKTYIGPDGPAADTRDREVVSFDARGVLVLRWLDPEIAGRYGTGVYVRCTARG